MEKIFLLPDLGEGLAEAIIREWYVKEGDMVTIDQSLAAMETDKALVDIPSPFQGTIKKIYGSVDDTIQTESPFILFELAEAANTKKDSQTVVGAIKHSDQITNFSSNDSATNTKQQLTAEAWSLLQKYSLSDDFLVRHFSHLNIITKQDLKEKFYELGLKPINQNKKSAGKGFDSVRNAMFNRITKAYDSVVPVSLYDNANITSWGNNSDFTVKIIKAIKAAIKEVPVINSHYCESDHSINTLSEVNCGIAMDSEHGLFVPVVKDIANINDNDMRKKINALKESVYNKKLKKDDTLNPTILLSNYGVFGAKFATPMVVPPMVCIVGLGQSHKQPIIDSNNNVISATILPISITVDHRIITGGEATRFLAKLIKHLEND